MTRKKKLTYSSINNTPLFKPLLNKYLFLRVCSTSLLKTLWEKEQFLETTKGITCYRIGGKILETTNAITYYRIGEYW